MGVELEHHENSKASDINLLARTLFNLLVDFIHSIILGFKSLHQTYV